MRAKFFLSMFYSIIIVIIIFILFQLINLYNSYMQVQKPFFLQLLVSPEWINTNSISIPLEYSDTQLIRVSMMLGVVCPWSRWWVEYRMGNPRLQRDTIPKQHCNDCYNQLNVRDSICLPAFCLRLLKNCRYFVLANIYFYLILRFVSKQQKRKKL